MTKQEQQLCIDTAKELAGCEGMDKSPWKIIKIKHSFGDKLFPIGHKYADKIARLSDNSELAPSIPYTEVKVVKSDYPRSSRVQEYYPWLKIDYFSEWCSAKFLKRAGWDADRQTLSVWLDEVIFHKSNYGELLTIETFMPLIKKALQEGNHPLAYMQAIILLYKIDRPAYDKAIKPLLGGIEDAQI